jgi:putative ABC transport system permease protein
VGLACCLLIVLFVRDEWSYDRFHEKADRIYRLTMQLGDFGSYATVPAVTARTVEDNFPEATRIARLFKSKPVLRHGDVRFQEERFFYTDPALFEVFTFPLIAGDPATALAEPETVILTRSTAERYFGTLDVIGQTLHQGDRTLRITGVAEDVPHNSHLKFDFLASFSTLTASGQEAGPWDHQSYLYVLVPDEQAATALQDKLDTRTDQDLEAVSQFFGWAAKGMSFGLQPLTRIHLYSNVSAEVEPNSDVRYLYLFSAIALFILLLAVINYTNLATARSARRAREVGVRKVLGAGRAQLARQFIGESVLFGVLALALAIVLLEALLPVFNTLTGKALALDYLADGALLPLFAGTALVTGLLAGLYPALVLSRFKPVRVLKSAVGLRGEGAWLRKGLVTFQFAISAALIAATLIVQYQLHFIRTKRLGYDTEQIVTMPLRPSARAQAETFTQALRQVPGVTEVSRASGPPTSGWESMSGPEDNQHRSRFIYADPDYLATMGMTLVEGRFFDLELAGDSAAYVVNETAARLFDLEDEVGQSAAGFLPDKRLIGIMRDFHTGSLHEPILPTFIEWAPPRQSGVIVRVALDDLEATLAGLKGVWDTFVPAEPFSYNFLDEVLANQYHAEQRLARIFGAFSLLAILIACLGLFGLAALTAEQRTKEVGIRKVMGASTMQIVVILSGDFTRLVLVSLVLAMPVAYFGMQRWLDGFAYRIDLGAWLFIASGALALFIAFATVSYQAIHTALANPVDSLRYE